MRITDVGGSKDRQSRRNDVVRRRLIKGYWEGKKIQQYYRGTVDDCIDYAKELGWAGLSIER